ncbi:MAG: YdcF family protein, partial [Terriglobales bacterium]
MAKSGKRGPWLPIVVAAAILALAFAAVTFVRIERQSWRDEARPADCIVVLGAAEYSGRPSPVLRARLD